MNKLSAIGMELRRHRKQRGVSQLELANLAGTTSRYISFIETGRSRPGRNIILRISEALNLTLRDSNYLLTSAGLPAAFEQTALNNEHMQPAKRVIEQVLQKHDPFPAWVIGPGLRFLASNAAAELIYPGLVGMEPEAIIDRWCAPNDLISVQERSYIVYQTLHGLRKEAFHYPHPDLPALISRVELYAAGLEAPIKQLDPEAISPNIIVNGEKVNTLVTVMRFDKVVSVTMAELRVELIFPADEASEAAFYALANGHHVA